MKKKQKIDYAALGSLGGKQTLKTHGTKHFRNIVNERWVKVRKLKVESLSEETKLPINKKNV